MTEAQIITLAVYGKYEAGEKIADSRKQSTK